MSNTPLTADLIDTGMGSLRAFLEDAGTHRGRLITITTEDARAIGKRLNDLQVSNRAEVELRLEFIAECQNETACASCRKTAKEALGLLRASSRRPLPPPPTTVPGGGELTPDQWNGPKRRI
jgi:hypothetical protein